MGRFSLKVLLEDSTWSTRYTLPKNDRYSNSSTDWTLVVLNFFAKNCGFKLIFDQLDTPHSNEFFNITTITHSVC